MAVIIKVTINKKLFIRTTVLFGLCLICLLSLGYYFSMQVGVTHVTVADKKFNEIFKGKQLVHITDLHMASIENREKKVLAILDALDPDYVFLTGDLIPWRGDVSVALGFLSQLHPKADAFGVMGDYDYSNDRSACLFCHKKDSAAKTSAHHVIMLKNTAQKIRVNDQSVYVLGLDDREQGENNLLNDLSKIPDNASLIVLAHNPLLFELFDKDKKMFMMAGDTHGGQIPLPKIIWKILGYEKNEKYGYGLFGEKKKKMFVSRGVGWSHLPFRLFANPEIVVYHFIKEQPGL